ncbi:MAG: hypothetical protein R2747_18000 [Pyrinomonadaceae bacterium]
MKTTKRTTITFETFERMVVQFRQTPPKVFCENCQRPISELPITKIAFAQPVSESEDVYLFVTESGVCFFLEIT